MQESDRVAVVYRPDWPGGVAFDVGAKEPLNKEHYEELCELKRKLSEILGEVKPIAAKTDRSHMAKENVA